MLQLSWLCCAIIEAAKQGDLGNMNKIAVYLNEHLLGEVSSAQSLRKLYATDRGVLSIAPEIVAFPKVTNDIRKVARFTWQLAEKGHIVGMTPRGFGGDVTGAAIGKGVVLDLSKHLTNVIQLAPKDKLIHVQPGASLATLNEALKWHGLRLTGTSQQETRPVTVGGAISNDSDGVDGPVSDSIERLEVVLANGDVIETGRMSRRDVSKKLGLQTFEGEIYRKLGALLEDNEELIKQLAADTTHDTTGYKRIASVRDKDGSYDLTPLFVGSQGTLGIISEIVLRTDFYSAEDTHAVIVADSIQTARDLCERFIELAPSELKAYDGSLFRRAAKSGAKFNILGSVDQIGAAVYVKFGDFNDRAQRAKLKKLRKLLQKMNMGMVDSTERDADDFRAVTDVAQALLYGTSDDHTTIPVLDGAFIPSNRREEFEIALAELGTKHHIELPVELNAMNGTYAIHSLLKLDTVGEKQKLFKLIADYAAVVDRCDGAFTSNGAEGRLKANAAWATLTDEQSALFEQVRAIFDPFGTLNPGVKQKTEMRSLVATLRTGYTTADML